MGTPDFLAPEQAQESAAVDTRRLLDVQRSRARLPTGHLRTACPLSDMVMSGIPTRGGEVELVLPAPAVGRGAEGLEVLMLLCRQAGFRRFALCWGSHSCWLAGGCEMVGCGTRRLKNDGVFDHQMCSQIRNPRECFPCRGSLSWGSRIRT